MAEAGCDGGTDGSSARDSEEVWEGSAGGC